MSKYKIIHLSDKVDFRFDLESWALPLYVSHWYDPRCNCKSTVIEILCFSIRILH